jgi:broad specificity phosphatase PhoE
MTARLTLICHGSTDAVRAAAFPMDEPLDHYGETGATELAGRLPNVDFSVPSCGPAKPPKRLD